MFRERGRIDAIEFLGVEGTGRPGPVEFQSHPNRGDGVDVATRGEACLRFQEDRRRISRGDRGRSCKLLRRRTVFARFKRVFPQFHQAGDLLDGIGIGLVLDHHLAFREGIEGDGGRPAERRFALGWERHRFGGRQERQTFLVGGTDHDVVVRSEAGR